MQYIAISLCLAQGSLITSALGSEIEEESKSKIVQCIQDKGDLYNPYFAEGKNPKGKDFLFLIKFSEKGHKKTNSSQRISLNNYSDFFANTYFKTGLECFNQEKIIPFLKEEMNESMYALFGSKNFSNIRIKKIQALFDKEKNQYTQEITTKNLRKKTFNDLIKECNLGETNYLVVSVILTRTTLKATTKA